MQIYYPYPPPWQQPKPPTGSGSSSKIAGSPGLLTSTGGLSGTQEALVTPIFNPITGKSYIAVHNSDNFDCEESCEYDFRQEANYGEISGEGREASFHRIILKYRELGNAKFFINITVFKKDLDDFVTVQIPVSIPILPLNTKQRKQSYPDKRIHTVILRPPGGVINGERPQVTYTRDANAGPCEITKLVLCGNADEVPEV